MAEWAYNPITGNLDRIGQGGGGGGNITISGDSGPPLNGDTFNFVGQEANTVPIMEVDTSTGDVVYANNSWATQYVVDNSVVAGLKGTFATLQEAVDTAFSDGNADGFLVANIMLRPGDYDISALVMPDSGSFHIYGESPQVENATSGIRFNGIGTLNFATGANIQWEILYFADIPTFEVTAGNQNFNNVGMNGAVFNGGNPSFRNCLQIGSDITINDTCGSFQSYDSYLYGNIQMNVTTNTGFNFYAHNSSLSGILGTNVGNLKMFNTKFEAINCNCSSGVDANNFLINCSNVTINGINPSRAITGSGDFYIANLSGYSYSPTPNIKTVSSTQGNIINSRVVAGDYVATIYDYYIGVSDTSVARTITLPDPSDLLVRLSHNQAFIVKDESGAAGTNNITINTAGGLIDGAASAALTNNYASLTFKSDGTNYYII
jgi:hypothetical protein